VEAADASLSAAVEDRRDVLVSLLAEVAINYIQLRGLQRELAIANETLAAQKETLSLTQKQFDAGRTAGLDLAQAQA